MNYLQLSRSLRAPGAPSVAPVVPPSYERNEINATPDPSTRCLDCQAPIPSADLFCPSCYARRQEARQARVVELGPYRAARQRARLLGVPCPVHGLVDWHVDERGDARCPACYPPAEVPR